MNINGVNGSYTSATDSNRMLQAPFPDRSFSHDPAGNILTSNAGLATFDAAGRLAELQSSAGTTHYGYNALGQRVIKESNAVDRSVIFGPVGIPPLPRRTTSVIYVYDLGQRLLGEYDGATGQAQREYIWLQDIPVAMITPDPTAPTGQPLVYFIHTDHLNTPRVVQDRNNAVRWRWLDEPFGSGLAQGDPSGLGWLVFNLRFPGQYFDAESGWHYNMNRYFEPGMGRYTQSDPIGLRGGINTYAYAEGNPISNTDPTGLISAEGQKLLDRIFGPKPDTSRCFTAECAAGLLPAPSDNRTQSQIDVGQCKIVCQISLSPAVMACNVAAGGGLPGAALGQVSKAGICSLVCGK